MQIREFKEPFIKFSSWFSQAVENKNIYEPTAMCISTVSKENKPSSRMVLLKDFNEDGFFFYTNSNSRKGKELEYNKFASICIYWGILGYQVRIEGEVSIISQAQSDIYFATRRRGSQIGAWSSEQSSKMNMWEDFQDRIKFYESKFANLEKIPRPSYWNGYLLKPEVIEFWQEGEYRLHKREKYIKENNKWQYSLLYP